MALYLAKVNYELREIHLKNKPAELLAASPKGTVPVLIDQGGQVYDESLEIIKLLLPTRVAFDSALLELLAQEFIPAINRFKYHSHYSDVDLAFEQQRLISVLSQFDKGIVAGNLGQPEFNQTDIAVLPFLRQLYRADSDWFREVATTQVKKYLSDFLDSAMHQEIMRKYPTWQPR